MTGPEGNSEFCFPRISMFTETTSRETLRFEGSKFHCSPRDQSLSDLLYSKTKQKQNLKTALRFQPLRATAVNGFIILEDCLVVVKDQLSTGVYIGVVTFISKVI